MATFRVKTAGNAQTTYDLVVEGYRLYTGERMLHVQDEHGASVASFPIERVVAAYDISKAKAE